MRRDLWIVVCVLLCAHTAVARDLYVDNVTGSDSSSGQYETWQQNTGPLRSLNRALSMAGPGDHVLLANTGVPYREMIGLSSGQHNGDATGPFTIDGRGATLDGSQSVPVQAWEFYSGPVFRFRPPRMAFGQLFRDGKPLVRRVAGVDGRLPELEPLEWSLYDTYIYFRVETDKLPGDYGLAYAGLQTGITIYNVHGILIANLTVQGFQLDGINAFDTVRDCRLQNVVCRGNGRAGLTVAGSSKVDLVGSLLGNNGEAQLRTEAWSTTRVSGSQLLDNTAPPLVRVGGRVLIDGVSVNAIP
jgi:hypothetical protein